MKLRSLVVLALLAIVSSCQKAEWKMLSIGDGAVTISMPAAPTESTQRLNTPAGDIEVRTFLLEQKTIAYSITYSDFPESLLATNSPEKLLDNARDGALSSTKGKLISEAAITLGEYPGREVKMETPEGTLAVVTRMYLVGHRLYQVAVALPKGEAIGEEPTKYFDSFKLLTK